MPPFNLIYLSCKIIILFKFQWKAKMPDYYKQGCLLVGELYGTVAEPFTDYYMYNMREGRGIIQMDYQDVSKFWHLPPSG